MKQRKLKHKFNLITVIKSEEKQTQPNNNGFRSIPFLLIVRYGMFFIVRSSFFLVEIFTSYKSKTKFFYFPGNKMKYNVQTYNSQLPFA